MEHRKNVVYINSDLTKDESRHSRSVGGYFEFEIFLWSSFRKIARDYTDEDFIKKYACRMTIRVCSTHSISWNILSRYHVSFETFLRIVEIVENVRARSCTTREIENEVVRAVASESSTLQKITVPEQQINESQEYTSGTKWRTRTSCHFGNSRDENERILNKRA